MKIYIQKLGESTFNVTVPGTVKTQHKVTVTDSSIHELTNGLVTKEALLNFSFKFLLNREPNTSILLSFEISDITRYFPEYLNEVKRWCNS